MGKTYSLFLVAAFLLGFALRGPVQKWLKSPPQPQDTRGHYFARCEPLPSRVVGAHQVGVPVGCTSWFDDELTGGADSHSDALENASETRVFWFTR